MTDWKPGDSIADLRERVSTLRGMLQDAHRREDRLRACLARMVEEFGCSDPDCEICAPAHAALGQERVRK